MRLFELFLTCVCLTVEWLYETTKVVVNYAHETLKEPDFMKTVVDSVNEFEYKEAVASMRHKLRKGVERYANTGKN